MNTNGSVKSGIAIVVIAGLASACARPTPIIEAPHLDVAKRQLNYQFQGHMRRLENGMVLLVLPDENTNLMKIDVRYRVGAAEDPAGKAGLAHLVEHLLFEIPGMGESTPTISHYLSSLALYHNAYTIWDETHYTAVAPEVLLDTLLKLESQRLMADCTQIDDALFAREREVVRNEIRDRAGMGARLAQSLYRDVYGAGHAYARSIGGSEAELAAITKNDVCDFLQRYYTPASAIMVVSGKVDVDRTRASFSRFFAGIPARQPGARNKVVPVSLRGRETVHHLEVEEATALVTFKAPMFADEDVVPDRLARRLIKRRLYKLLQDEKYITDVTVGSAGGVRAPLTVIAISVDEPRRLHDTVDRVFHEIDRMSDGVKARPLGVLADDARAQLLLAMEPFHREAEAFADHLQYADHDQFIIPLLEGYGSITLDEVQRYASRTFVRERSHVMYVYPDEREQPEEQRAPLAFDHAGYDIEDWRRTVNLAEAERDLPIQMRGMDTFIREFKLDNGIRVVMAPALGYPVVDIRLVLPGGNWHEPEDLPGLADVAALLMEPGRFRVNRKVPPLVAQAAFDAVLNMGGEVEGSAGTRTTTLGISGLSMYVDGLLWKLYWQARTGHYDSETIARWRSLSGRGESRKKKREVRKIRVFMSALLGADHPYVTRPSMSELISRVGAEQLQRFHERNHRTRGATLIITGQFPAAFVESEVRRLFGSLPAGDAPAPRKPPVARPGKARYLAFVDQRAVQTEIRMAYLIPARELTDMPARNVLEEMIRVNMSSLRERLGASYGVQVSYSNSDHQGMVLIRASVDRERASVAYRAMREIMDEIRAGKAVAAFVRARRQVVRELLADKLDSKAVADELETFAKHGLPSDFWEKQARRVARMRMDEIQAVAKRDLDAAHEVVLIEGRRASIDAAYQAAGTKGVEFIE